MKGPLTIQWKTRSGTGAPADSKWSQFCKVLPGPKNMADEGAAKMIVRVLNENTTSNVRLMEFRVKEARSTRGPEI